MSEQGMRTLPAGTICIWPNLLPTPTPLPVCGTPIGGDTCVVKE